MESTSARDLDRRLADLVRSERHLVVQFVLELAGFARGELYRQLGYTSLFHYCVRQLGLSKSSAFRRSEVARLIVRFPAIADRLAAGRLGIRALVELREVLTEENHAGVLARVEGKSQEEAQLLAVEIKPRHVPRNVVRTLVSAETRPWAWPGESAAAPNGLVSAETRPPPPPPEVAVSPVAAVSTETRFGPRPVGAGALEEEPVSAETRPPGPPEVVKPLTPALRRLSVTVSAEFIAELEQVRSALSHRCPDGDFEQVLREAFRLVLERDRKRKALTAGLRPQQPARKSPPAQLQPPPETRQPEETRPPEQTRAPWKSPPSLPLHEAPGNDARYIPAAVRRAVWERDRGRCTWPMGDGHVCGTTHRLEFDHDLEIALGGKSTLDNIRLLCRSHNLLKAEEHLGRALMARFRRGRQAVPAGS